MNIITMEEAKLLAGGYQSIPITCTMQTGDKTPVEVLNSLKTVSRQSYILESREKADQSGRYTFLGYDPKMEISCTDGTMCIKAGSAVSFETKDPGSYIKKIVDENKCPKIAELPPFTGGLVGYFSFEYMKYSEPTLLFSANDEEKFKDFDLMLFDKVIAFDHLYNQIILIVNIKTDGLTENYAKALVELDSMKALLSKAEACGAKPLGIISPFKPLFDKAAFCRMVDKAKGYIRNGDIFQVVLSNRLSADADGSLLDTYRVLRKANPSPYMFYFSSDDVEIAGASPETLVKLKDGELYTFPLAGTRPRGESAIEDERLEKELFADEKERAEHNMLVDLGRNDIGKISRFGTVSVEKYMNIEKFSHVMHIGSTVKGQIREDKDAMDAVDAVLPAGTLSGAPKIRACEIINNLENNKRGIYGGAIGYIAFSGNMDTCISIRLAFKKNGKIFVRSGAGIVADSDPEKEYEECIHKAKAVINAIETAEGGLSDDFID